MIFPGKPFELHERSSVIMDGTEYKGEREVCIPVDPEIKASKRTLNLLESPHVLWALQHHPEDGKVRRIRYYGAVREVF